MKKKKIDTEILKKKDFGKLYRFYRQNFKDHIFSKYQNYLKWQYQSQKSKFNIIILKISGRIRGFQFFIPMSYFDKSLSKKEIFLTNFYCDPKIIGGGQIIFKNLIKKVKPDFIGTTGFKTSMINYHKKLRFNVNTLKHFYLKKNKINKFKYNSENFKLLYKNDILGLEKKVFKYQTPLKSKKFIINRYINHPVYKYFIYTNLKIKNKSIIILREIKFKNKKYLKIIDFFGSNTNFKDYKNLFNYLILEKKYFSIDMYCYGISKKTVISSGLKKNTFKDIIPEYYEPFVNKNINLNCGYYVKKKKNRIRLFKGDGDRDRPSILSLNQKFKYNDFK